MKPTTSLPWRPCSWLVAVIRSARVLFGRSCFDIRFMWPILLVTALIVIFGVWKLHAVIVFARMSVAPSHPVRRFVWVQELAFWSMVSAGAYGIYLLMSEI